MRREKLDKYLPEPSRNINYYDHITGAEILPPHKVDY